MMQLQALISLKDMFSNPLAKATTAMDNFEKQAKYTTDANGRLRNEFGRFVGGANSAKGSMLGLTGVAKGLTTALGGLGAGMVAMNTVNLAMNFESQMSTIKALTGATGQEMKQMTDLALEMGAQTKYEECFTAA